MTTVDERAIEVLRTYGPQTCSGLGAILWGSDRKFPQSYARPAGKVLHRLLKAGRVTKRYDRFRQKDLWQLATG